MAFPANGNSDTGSELIEPPTLYDRIGGADAISSMVRQFYAAVLDDPSLKRYFRHVTMDKLLRMQEEFFAAALGGPVKYSGRPITFVYHHLHIYLAAFQRFAQHLFDVLRRYELTEQECYDVISRLNLYVNNVVGTQPGFDGRA